MKIKTSVLAAMLLASLYLIGCASVSTVQTDTDQMGNVRETRFKARTFFDSKNELAKARTTMTDKSQGVTIAGLEQESSGSNAVSLAASIAAAVTAAAVKAVVPVP